MTFIRDVLPLINSGKVELLDLAKLEAQFVGLERRTARGGRDSIDHAPGGHDDLVNAACGALLRAGSHRPMKINAAAVAALARMTPLPGSPNYRRSAVLIQGGASHDGSIYKSPGLLLPPGRSGLVPVSFLDFKTRSSPPPPLCPRRVPAAGNPIRNSPL